MERLYATPFGFGFVNAFDCQEIEELHDSLHFSHIWKAYPAIRRLVLQMQNWTCTVVDIMTQSTAEPYISYMHALQVTNPFATNLDISLMWDVRGVSRVVKQEEWVFRGD